MRAVRLGTRVVQLAYNDRSFAADGCGTDADAGLSRHGREFVREMNRIGIVLDLTHVGERSSLEAIEISTKPPIFSHSNPRSRVNALRNITDEQIRKVAAKGGVIGLTTFPPLNWTGANAIPTLDDFLDNIEYVVDMVGIDHVAVGTDSEATPGADPLRAVQERRMRKIGTDTEASPGKFSVMGSYDEAFKVNLEALDLDGFCGMGDFPLITQGLLDRGYDAASVRKVLGLNLVRVFRKVWN